MGAGGYYGGEESVANWGERRWEVVDWGYKEGEWREVNVEEINKWGFGQIIFRNDFSISAQFDHICQEK